MFNRYLDKLKSFFAPSSQGSRGLNLSIDIGFHWKILCTVFLVIIFLVLVADIYFFILSKEEIDYSTKAQLENFLMLDKSKLDNAIRDWRDKEILFNKFFKEKTKFIDPSL